MKNNLRKLFIFGMFFLSSSCAIFGMIPGTRILVKGDDHKNVEDFKIGDLLSIYSIKDKGLEGELREIEEIEIEKIKEVIVIKTDLGDFVFGPEQRIYNRKIFKFVRANELTTDDLLYSPELKNIAIKDVYTKKLKDKTQIYKISIKDKNLFLALIDDKNHILLHNEPITIALVTVAWGAGETVVQWVGLAALGVFAKKILADIFKKKLEKNGVDVSGLKIEDLSNQSFIGGSSGPDKDPKDDDKDFKKPLEGDSCKIIKGVSKAPEKLEPNSGYYKLDNSNKTDIVSKTVYNEDGQPNFREDYKIGEDFRSHFDKKTGVEFTGNHRHTFEYNENGKVIKPVKIESLD